MLYQKDEWLVSLKTTQLPNDNKCVSLNEYYNEEATPTSYIVYIYVVNYKSVVSSNYRKHLSKD